MNIRTETIGSLRCRIVDGFRDGEKPNLIVILCHGYGASGSDLVSIGEDLLTSSQTIRQQTQFLFPEAPLSLEDIGIYGGRAWWPLDLMKLQLAVATGRHRDLQSETPPGLEHARQLLAETAELWSQKNGIPLTRFVMGGFSQGAMVTTDVALHLNVNLACLLVMSGTLINEAEWRQQAPQHAGLRVLQSHGTLDPMLPFSMAESLRDLLVAAGQTVEFVSFRGQHQIPLEVLQRFSTVLEDLMNSPSSSD